MIKTKIHIASHDDCLLPSPSRYERHIWLDPNRGYQTQLRSLSRWITLQIAVVIAIVCVLTVSPTALPAQMWY